MPADPSLFVPARGDRWLPTDHARGPWHVDALHGGPTAALLAGAAEALVPGMHPARMTVELLRPVPVAPLRLEAKVVRPGRKVTLVEATVSTDAGPVARATLLAIRRAAVPTPPAPTREPPPLPDRESEQPPGFMNALSPAFHNAGVEHRFAVGRFDRPGPAVDWIRLRVPVVPGREPTPLQRVVAAADFGNGIASATDWTTHTFINPDLTVHLVRVPVGEWVCLDASTQVSDEGIGLAQSELWDEKGPIGRSLQSLVVEPR